jgi:hypothetical protein
MFYCFLQASLIHLITNTHKWKTKNSSWSMKFLSEKWRNAILQRNPMGFGASLVADLEEVPWDLPVLWLVCLLEDPMLA